MIDDQIIFNRWSYKKKKKTLTGSSSGEFLWSSSELELCSERCLCPFRKVDVVDDGGVGLGAALFFLRLRLFSEPGLHAGGAASDNGSRKKSNYVKFIDESNKIHEFS